MGGGILEYVTAAVTALLTIVALIVVNSYGRHRRLKVSEHRVKPYAALWSKTQKASADRISHGKSLTPSEARDLADDLRAWYYGAHGGGLLLPIPTLKMLLLILGDLDRLADGDLRTDAARDDAGRDCLSAISILRTQLKIDLDVYDIDERQQLQCENMGRERDFLRRCCFDVEKWGRPDRWFRRSSFNWDRYTGTYHRWLTRSRAGIVPLSTPCDEPCMSSSSSK